MVAEREAIKDNPALDIVAVSRNTGVVFACTVCVGLNEGDSWAAGVANVRLTHGVGVYEEDSHANDNL